MKNLKNYDASGTNEILVDTLRRYVAQCGETAQKFIEKADFQIAEKILRSCENLLKTKMPENLVAQTGMFYQVNNNLANLANRNGDVQASIRYLLAALDCANDPRIQSKDDLTISETLLNLANANIYLSKFEFGLRYADQAYQFAAKNCDGLQQMIRGCDQKRAHLGESHPEIVKMQDYYNSLQDQYLNQVHLKVLAKYATGQAFEKMEKFDNAIHEFRIGTQLVENNLGTKHYMYAVLANAMGGARLKTKFQTKEVISRKKPSPKRKSPPKEQTKTKRKESDQPKPKLKSPIKDQIKFQREKSAGAPSNQKPLRPISASSKLVSRRNIKKIIDQDIVDYHKKTHVADVRRSSKKNLSDNLFMTNCDTWADVHCHRPKPHRSRSSSKSLRIAQSIKTFDDSIISLNSRRSEFRSPKVRIKKIKKPTINKVKQQISSEQLESSNETLNIKITPKKKQEKSSPDITNKSTHDSKQTIIIRETPPNSISQSSQQTPFNGAYMKQLQLMRQMQEDQFKMMQLIIQSKRQNEVQPLNYMPYYGHGMLPFQGYYPYPYDYRYMQGSQATETDYSETDRTETDHRSDFERSEPKKQDMKQNSTKKPKKDENSKKVKRMSEESPTDINDRESNQMTFPPKTTSQVSRAYKTDQEKSLDSDQFKHNRNMSKSGLIHDSAHKRTTTFKEEAVREIENTNSLAASPPFKSSFKAKSTQDLQVFEDTQKIKLDKSPQQNKKGSTVSVKSKADSTVYEQSFRADSTVYEKSFRAPEPKLSQAEAAIIIQKNFKGYLVREKMHYIAQSKKKVSQLLLKTNYRCKSGTRPIVTCKVISEGLFAKGLEFHIDKPLNQKFEIELHKLGKFEVDGLKRKVLKILEQCQKSGDVQKDIKTAFKSVLAKKILSDDEEESNQENPFQENGLAESTIQEQNVGNLEIESEYQVAQRPRSQTLTCRELMQSEFIKIKQQMMGIAIQLNKVEVLDYKPRFLRSEEQSPSSSDSDSISLIKGGNDDHLQPVIIQKIQVNRRFKKHRKNKETKSRSSSEHSYKVFLDEQTEKILWEGEINKKNLVFKVKLVKLDFLEYVLTAEYNQTKKEIKISHLPFEEEQAQTHFEQSLILDYDKGIIKELNLIQTGQSGSQAGEYSRSSKHNSFAQIENYSRKVIYMFNTLRYDQTEYHVEVTKQYTDSFQLTVYVINVKEFADKDKIIVPTNFIVEKAKENTNSNISHYVEDNLMINRKIGDKHNQISHLSISYPKQLLNFNDYFYQEWMRVKMEQKEQENKFKLQHDGQTYIIVVDQVQEKGISILCVNEQSKDFCLFQLSKLDHQGNLADFLKKNLRIFTNKNGNLSKLKVAGFIDGEGDELVQQVSVDDGYWRLLHQVQFEFAETQLISQLLISVLSKAEVHNVKIPIPAIQDDCSWYKIQIFHVNQNKPIGDIVLTPSQCEILLTSDLTSEQSIGEQNMPCAKYKKGSMQLQAAIKKSIFEKNQQQWEKVLSSAIYMQSSKEVRFRAPPTPQFSEERSITPMNESSFVQIDQSIEQLLNEEVKYEDEHMIQLLKNNEEYLQELNNPAEQVQLKQIKNTNVDKNVPAKGKILKNQPSTNVQDDADQEEMELEQDDIKKLKEKQEEIKKRIKAAKKKAKKEKKAREADNQAMSERKEEGKKMVGGIVKCDGSKLYLNFTLAVDPKTSQIVLTVKEKSKDGKFLAKNQVLNQTYIREITLDDHLAEGYEILNLIKVDLESKLRKNGARLIQQGSSSLPQAFFSQQVTEDDLKQDQGEKQNQKPDGRLLHQRSVQALRMKKANDEEEDYYKDDTLSELEQNMNQIRGAVRAKDSDQFFNIALFLDPQSKEIALTVKQIGAQGLYFAQKQKLAIDYIQSVVGQVRIKKGDNSKVLQKLKADIEQRLKEFGGDLKPGNSLPQIFFAIQDQDDQEVSFQEPATPKETQIQLSPSNQDQSSPKKTINFYDKKKIESSQKKIAAAFRGKQEREKLESNEKRKLNGACKMDNQQFIRYQIADHGGEYKLTVMTVNKKTILKDVSLPSNITIKDDFQDEEEFKAALKDAVEELLKKKGSEICETGAIPKSLC